MHFNLSLHWTAPGDITELTGAFHSVLWQSGSEGITAVSKWIFHQMFCLRVIPFLGRVEKVFRGC